MTATYEGAVAAIQARMTANWTESVPVSFQNEQAPQSLWPPADGSPFIYFEVLTTGSNIYAAGLPGSQLWRTLGLIHAHLFVPIGSGSALAQKYAREIGDIFRNQRFYNDTPPSFVWTISPQTDGGGPSDQYAAYWRLTCTIDFQFYFLG